jgi:hypothetical protein
MSSVGDVDPGVTAAPEDELNQRAAAAARAFAALNRDDGGEPGPSPGAPAEPVSDPGPAAASATGPAGDPVAGSGTGASAGAGTTTGGTGASAGAGTTTGGTAGAGTTTGGTSGAGPTATGARAPSGAEAGEGPLRPDAVYQGFVRGTEASGAPGPAAAPGDERPVWGEPGDLRGSTARAWPVGPRPPETQPTGPGGGSRGVAGDTRTAPTAAGDHRRGAAAGDHGREPASDDVLSGGAAAAPRTGSPAGAAAGTSSTSADPGFDPPARRVDRHLLDLWAAAAASVAFVSPVTWLAVVAVVAATGAVLRSMADHGPRPAGVVHRALRRVRGALRPRTLAAVVAILVHGALTAVLVPAALAMAWWGLRHGAVGVLAAGRSGVLAQAPRAAVALACYALIAGLGPVRERRVAQLRELTGRVSGSTVAAMSMAAVVFTVAVTTVVPRADAGPLAGDDGLGWAPPSVRGRIDRLRDVVVEAELHAAAGCLNGPQGLRWDVSYTRRNPVGDEDVARLTFGAGVPTPGDLATVAAALHNQLAPWVETIELASPSRPLLVVDRSELPSSSPLADAEALANAATKGRALVEDGIEDFDRSLALDCSVSPVL